MAFFETEQKYRLKSPATARAILKRMGARKIAAGAESNEFYDRGGLLRRQRIALRLRKFGKGPATLTLKGPRIRSRYTKRMEIETPIDHATAKAMLRLFGCRVVRRYSKRRELYKLGSAIVTLDFLKKFGWFLEIEADPRSIQKLETKLGLGRKDREAKSYLQMMFGWKH